MTAKIGKNTNTNTEANSAIISVDSTVRTTLLAAQVAGDSVRICVNVANAGNRTLWVAKEAASANNDKKSTPISPGESKCIVDNGDIYTGEISAIFESGGARNVIVEWF